jgi:hypothetical protein
MKNAAVTVENQYAVCVACQLPCDESDACPHCGRMAPPVGVLREVEEVPASFKQNPGTTKFTAVKRWRTPSNLVVAAVLAAAGVGMGQNAIAGSNLWLLVGACAVFYVVALVLINRTTITVSSDSLQVKRGPLYAPLADSFLLNKLQIKRLDLFRVTGEKASATRYEIKALNEKGELLNVLDLKNIEEAVQIYQFLRASLTLEEKRERITPQAFDKFESSKARRISLIYYGAIPGGMIVNVALGTLVKAWRFDAGFWVTFAVFTAAIFALFFLHHRKYLSIMDSRPLREGQQPASAGAYLFMSIIYGVIHIPIAMWIYQILN